MPSLTGRVGKGGSYIRGEIPPANVSYCINAIRNISLSSPLQTEFKDKMKSLLRLFRAVQVETDRRQLADKAILELTLKKGFIFSPEVFYHYSKQDLVYLANLIEKEIGLTPEQLNASFHKSWQKIAEACIEQLVIEQLIHYVTTYGYEAAGIYDSESVYIPNERLDIPEYVGGINVVVIHGYKPARIKEKVLSLLSSGIALKEDTIKDVLDVCKKVDLQQADLESIKNKEVKIALMDYFDLVPEDPVEFLRYLVFKATDKTLLIKDEPTITAIKESTGLNRINELFNRYEKEFGLETLAQIFLRFKPLFLAFKENKKNRPKINKIRKLATKYHKPLPKDFLNEITSMIKKGVKIDRGKLERELEKVNIYRLI